MMYPTSYLIIQLSSTVIVVTVIVVTVISFGFNTLGVAKLILNGFPSAEFESSSSKLGFQTILVLVPSTDKTVVA